MPLTHCQLHPWWVAVQLQCRRRNASLFACCTSPSHPATIGSHRIRSWCWCWCWYVLFSVLGFVLAVADSITIIIS